MSVPPIIPTECPWLYDVLVGQDWPAGDEDAMRRSKQAWLDAKAQIRQAAGNGNDASTGVTDNVQAVSVDAFTTFWNEYIAGDKSVLGELLAQCDGLASALGSQANEVEYSKLSIDITIVVIAIQIVLAIAEAVFSLGGSLLEIPFITLFGQRAVAMLLSRFLQMALMMILPDVISQIVLQAQGEQKGWDWSKTVPALESAGIAGVLGMVGGTAVNKLPFMRTEAATWGGKVLQGLVHFGEGGTVNVMTGIGVDMVNGKQIDPAMLLTQFASGGTMAITFFTVHAFGPDKTPLTFVGTDGNNYHILLDSKAMDDFNANGQRLPDGFTAPVYNEKGLRVGTATFSDVGPSLDATPDTSGTQLDPSLGHTDLSGTQVDPSLGHTDPSGIQLDTSAGQTGDSAAQPSVPGGHDAPVSSDSPGGQDVSGSQGGTSGGQTVRIDTLLHRGQPTDLTGYSVAGHDGSVQTYGYDHGQFSKISYAAPSDGSVKIATAVDGARSETTVPAGSIVRYTADGVPYRADITDGQTVTVWQTSTPGSPLERTGTIVHPDAGPVGKFFGLEEAAFYAQDGTQVGAISLLTGWLHLNDPTGYASAIGEQYHAAADPLTALVGAGEVPADVAAAVRGTGVDVSRFADAMKADVRLDGPDLLTGSEKVQALAQVAADYGNRGLDLVTGGLSVRETADLVPVLDRADAAIGGAVGALLLRGLDPRSRALLLSGGDVSSAVVDLARNGTIRQADELRRYIEEEVIGRLSGEPPSVLGLTLLRLMAARARAGEPVYLDDFSTHPSMLTIEEMWGLPQHAQRWLQQIADAYDLVIDVRPANHDAVALLEVGGVPKPPAIKLKSINGLDRELGAPDMIGAVGFFKPELPVRAEVTSDEHWAALEARFNQRLEEYNHYGDLMKQLEAEGKFRVVDGVVYPYDPQPIVRGEAGRYGTLLVGEPHVDENQVRHSAPVGSDDNGGLRPPIDIRPEPDPLLGPPISGDVDLFNIRRADGSVLSFEQPVVEPGHAEPRIWYTKLVNEDAMTMDQYTGKGKDTGMMLEGGRMSIQHGAIKIYLEHADITDPEEMKGYQKILVNHLPGGEPLVRFQPRRAPELVDSFTPIFDEAGKPILTRLLPPGPDEGRLLPEDYTMAGDHPRTAIAEALNGADSLGHGSAVAGDLSHDPLTAGGHEPVVHINVIRGAGDHQVFDLEAANGEVVTVHLDRVSSGWVISEEGPAGDKIWAAAQALLDDGHLNFLGHGDQYGLLFGRLRLSFEDFAELIRPVLDDGSVVRLLVCHAGLGDGPAVLARLLDRSVLSTKDIVWFDTRGGVRSAAPAEENGRPYPGAPGSWELTHPNGTVENGDAVRPSETGRSGEPLPGEAGDWEQAGFVKNEQPDRRPPPEVVDAVKSDPAGPGRAGVVGRTRRGVPLVDISGRPREELNPNTPQNFPELMPELNRSMSRAAFKVLLNALRLDESADAALIAHIAARLAEGKELGEILREQYVAHELARTPDIAGIIRDRADRRYGEKQPRPIQDFIDEALTKFINPRLHPSFKGTDFAQMEQVRIADTYQGTRPSEIVTGFPQYDAQQQHGTNLNRADYGLIASDLDAYRGRALAGGLDGAEFDRRYADALLRLLNPGRRASGLAELEALAQKVDPRYGVDPRYPSRAQARSYDQWTGRSPRIVNEGATFVRQAFSLCDLIFDVETARHPEALFSNLMAMELVRQGRLSLQDMFFYNIMRPSGANNIAARVDWVHGYIDKFAPKLGGGRETNTDLLYDMAEFQRREREIWGRYVQEYLGLDPAEFFSDQIVDGLNREERLQQLLADMLDAVGIG